MNMSAMGERRGTSGPDTGDNADGMARKRATFLRSFRGLLTIGTQQAGSLRTPPAALVHMVGVYLLEMETMARGGKNGTKEPVGNGLPKFVDIRLTPEQKVEFLTQMLSAAEAVQALQSLSDDGYRVGVSWSGEHQTYTVSLTARDPGNVNFGYCMTSFAGDILKAISLAVYKHVIVTGEKWVPDALRDAGDFG